MIKKEKEITKTISYRLLFIDRARFMANSLSNLNNNLAEEIRKLNVNMAIIKIWHNKKCETFGFKYKDCKCCLEYINFKDDSIEHKCLCCNNSYPENFDENLKNQFVNICKPSNHDINKFIVLLQKGAYPY